MKLNSVSQPIEQTSSYQLTDAPQCHGAEWISSIREVLKYLHNLDSRLNELKVMQADIDKEICDIYHYIEFKQLNASQGYKAYRTLHEVLLRRRAIKDEIYAATAIKNHSSGRFDFDAAIRMIEGMSSREYKPRTIEGIFTGGV